MKTQLTPSRRIHTGPAVTKIWRCFGAMLFLTVSSSFTLNAQQIQWDKSYGGVVTGESSECDDRLGISSPAEIIPTSDGGYLLGGTSNSRKGNDKSEDNRGTPSGDDCLDEFKSTSDYWIIKTDANGKKLWDKTIGGDKRDVLKSIVATPDGGYLLGGQSESGKSGDKSDAYRGGYGADYWVVKIDSNGNKQWDKTFGGNYFETFAALVPTPDGGYLLGGTSLSGINGDKTKAGSYWVVKINANGNKQWDKAYESSNTSGLTDLIPTMDGNYLLGGNIFGENLTDYRIIKIDGDGNKLWSKTFGGKNTDYLHALTSTPDGGYLLSGESYSGVSGDKTEANQGNVDYWVVKIDAVGNKEWDKTFGGADVDQFADVVITPDGNFLIGGSSASGISGNKTEVNRGTTDYWLVKLGANGTKLWDRTIGSNGYDQLSALLITTDRNYLVAGSTDGGISGDKSQALKGVKDFWVVKIKEETTPEATAWDMRYGGTGEDNLSDVIKTSDGGYLTAGYTNSGVSGDKTQSRQGQNDYWIVKSDKNGKKLWDKRFGGTDHDYLNRVIQTQDGGYLLAGSSRSGKSGDKSEANFGGGSGTFADRDYWLVKVDAQGNKQWDKRYGGLGYEDLLKVVQLPTGEYVLGGQSSSPVSGDKSQASQGELDYWLVKISATGTKLWDQRYGGLRDELLGSFTVTRDGGFLLAGTSYSGQSGDKSEPSRGTQGGTRDYWVVRTDKEGRKLWDKTYGGRNYDEAYSVGRGEGDTFYISGTSYSPQGGDKSEPGQLSPAGTTTPDYWVVKIDGTGKKLWDRTLGGNNWDLLRASTVTPDGGIVLAGYSDSERSGAKSQNSRGGLDYWVVQLDGTGKQQGDQTIGGSGREELRTVLQTSDGGLLLGGRSNSGVSGERTQPSQGGNDYWLVKVAPLTTPAVAAREATPAAATLNQLQVQAYPNPAQDKATISFTLPETQQATVKVYDGQGYEVATLFNGEAKAKQVYEVEWQAGNKPAGLYFLQLQTSTKKQQQKLLLSK